MGKPKPKAKTRPPRELPAGISKKQRDQVRESELDSLREDIQQAGIDEKTARGMEDGHIRALAAARRADGQVERLTEVRAILTSAINELRACNVPMHLLPTTEGEKGTALQAIPRVLKSLERACHVARDITAMWWKKCVACPHFSIDHRRLGGCVKCTCTERGHHDFELEELSRL